jgi:hypothetical protein
MILTFDGESSQDLNDGIEHVRDEVIPAFERSGGVKGWWLVNREAGRRITVMVWESEEEFQAGMAGVQEPVHKTPTVIGLRRHQWSDLRSMARSLACERPPAPVHIWVSILDSSRAMVSGTPCPSQYLVAPQRVEPALIQMAPTYRPV